MHGNDLQDVQENIKKLPKDNRTIIEAMFF